MTPSPKGEDRDLTPASDATRGFAMFLDVDGTLLDIADRPDQVIVPPTLVTTLAKLEVALDGALALISGRMIEDLDRLFAPLRLRASGVHGAEMRFDPDAKISISSAAPELPSSLWNKLTDRLAAFPGAFAENKRFSFTAHFRDAPAAEPEVRAAMEALVASDAPGGIALLDAHSAIEIKSVGIDKGEALRQFLQRPPFAGRKPVYFGDDVTDEAAFAVARALGGFAYSVGAARPYAQAVFANPQAVRDWLAEFASRRESRLGETV